CLSRKPADAVVKPEDADHGEKSRVRLYQRRLAVVFERVGWRATVEDQLRERIRRPAGTLGLLRSAARRRRKTDLRSRRLQCDRGCFEQAYGRGDLEDRSSQPRR